jgi:hypothetical protein
VAFLKASRPAIVLPMREPRGINQVGSMIGFEATSNSNKHQVNLSIHDLTAAGGESESCLALRHRTAGPVGRVQRINFDDINRAALSSIGSVLVRLLPGGRVVGGEYLALNPRRADTHLGSFKVRVAGARAGCWSDFATRDHGGDLVSLVAYLEGVSQGEAARRLAQVLGLETGRRRNG